MSASPCFPAPPKQSILILGAGVMQGPALKLARELGLTVIAVDGNPAAPCRNLADRFEPIDLKDIDALSSFAAALREETVLAGVFTAGTDFSASAAYVAEKNGLPGIPYEAALNATDKERMRRCFAAQAVPSPAFTVINDPAQAGAALPFPYPVVVKPVDNMGARGCRLAVNQHECYAASVTALSYSRSARVIIEEYMDGPEYSVDALVYRGNVTICGLAERHIRYPPYFIEMGHTMPAALASKDEQSLIEVFIAGIRSLGITEGAAKGDLKLTRKGAMVGEIAARLSGGYMSGWTYPYASGVEATRAALRIACGLPPDNIAPQKHWVSAERAYISIPGTVAVILGAEKAAKERHINDLFCHIKAGSAVLFPENNVSKCGSLISAAPDRDAACRAAEKAACAMLIGLAVPRKETDDFLAAPLDTVFPPSAFNCDRPVHIALESLPETCLSENEPPRVLAFPAFTGSAVRDYAGRTPLESLDAVRTLTGLSLPLANDGNLGCGFWRAMLRGGYQGAAYYIERQRGVQPMPSL